MFYVPFLHGRPFQLYLDCDWLIRRGRTEYQPIPCASSCPHFQSPDDCPWPTSKKLIALHPSIVLQFHSLILPNLFLLRVVYVDLRTLYLRWGVRSRFLINITVNLPPMYARLVLNTKLNIRKYSFKKIDFMRKVIFKYWQWKFVCQLRSENCC